MEKTVTRQFPTPVLSDQQLAEIVKAWWQLSAEADDHTIVALKTAGMNMHVQDLEERLSDLCDAIEPLVGDARWVYEATGDETPEWLTSLWTEEETS